MKNKFLIWDDFRESWVDSGMNDWEGIWDALSNPFDNREYAEGRMKAWDIYGEVKEIEVKVL